MGQRKQRQLGKDDDFDHHPAFMDIAALRISYYPQTQKGCLRGVKNSTKKKKNQSSYLSFTTSLMVI